MDRSDEPPVSTLQSRLDSPHRETGASDCVQSRDWCRTRPTTRQITTAFGRPVLNGLLAFCHRPGLLLGVWAVFPIRSDPRVAGNAVSPPLVPGRTGGRDHASEPRRCRLRSRCWLPPSAHAVQRGYLRIRSRTPDASSPAKGDQSQHPRPRSRVEIH